MVSIVTACVLFLPSSRRNVAAYSGSPQPQCAGRSICPAVYFYGPADEIPTYVNQLNQFTLAVVSGDYQIQNYFSGTPAVDPTVAALLYFNIYIQPRWPDWAPLWNWSITNQHEDWYLHDSVGNRIYNTRWGDPDGTSSLYYMNVQNPDYITYIITTIQATFAAYPALDGLFIDGPPRWEYFSAYELDGLSCYNANSALDTCPDGVGDVWENESNFYSYLTPNYDHVFNDPAIVNKTMIVNSSCAPQFNAISDGCLHEHAFHYYDRPFTVDYRKTEAIWLRDIQWLADSSTDNRLSIVLTGANTSNMPPAVRQQAEWYEYASFLIGQNPNSTAMMAWVQDTNNQITYSALNDVDLGAPTGPYVQDWQGQDGIYERPYAKGIVLVHANRDVPAKTVNLPDSYRTLDGQLVSGSYELQPNTGHILKLADIISPSPPLNPVATADTTTQVTLRWDASTDNVGVTGYRIYRDDALITTVATNAPHSDADLTPGTTYTYSLTAIDADGNASVRSATATVTTPNAPDTTRPGTVVDLRASAP